MALAVSCTQHPRRESTATCIQCGEPLCALCAVQTVAGSACKSCVSGAQRTNQAVAADRSPAELLFIIAAIAGIIGWAAVYGAQALAGIVSMFGVAGAGIAGVLVGVGVGRVTSSFAGEGNGFVTRIAALVGTFAGCLLVSCAVALLLGVSNPCEQDLNVLSACAVLNAAGLPGTLILVILSSFLPALTAFFAAGDRSPDLV